MQAVRLGGFIQGPLVRCLPGSTLLLLPGPRMRCIIDLRQMLEIKMGINLRGADTGVPQHFLHRAQVATGLQQVGGK